MSLRPALSPQQWESVVLMPELPILQKQIRDRGPLQVLAKWQLQRGTTARQRTVERHSRIRVEMATLGFGRSQGVLGDTTRAGAIRGGRQEKLMRAQQPAACPQLSAPFFLTLPTHSLRFAPSPRTWGPGMAILSAAHALKMLEYAEHFWSCAVRHNS